MQDWELDDLLDLLAKIENNRMNMQDIHRIRWSRSSGGLYTVNSEYKRSVQQMV